MANTHFDIVVSGAGIAGLLIASELSSKKKVLVIETKTEADTTKFWLTLKSCLDNNVELAGFVDNCFGYMDFSDAYRNCFRLTGSYVLWEPDDLIDYLKKKILSNNGQIKFDQKFCGYKAKQNAIEVYVNEHCYTAKLFVDCMGYNSPLVLAKDMVQFKGFYLLYGAKMKLKEMMDPICLSNVILDKRPKYFEAFPTSKGDVFATIIYPTTNLTDTKGLAADFKFLVTKSVYAKHFEPDKILSRIWGVVPVGNIRRKALDRVFFFGESAQSNPAATGTCLTRLLFNYKKVAVFLDSKIEENELTEEALSESPTILNTFNRKLHLYTFRDILSWNSDRFSKFINMIDRIDHQLLNKFIFGELTISDIVTRKHMLALFRPRNYFFVGPLIRSFR